MKKDEYLITDPPLKALTVFAMPMILGSFFQQVYNMADSIIVGQFVGSSALAAVAQLRGAIWGLLLFTADSLADIDNYDQRDWGSEAFDKALELCLDIIVQM